MKIVIGVDKTGNPFAGIEEKELNANENELLLYQKIIEIVSRCRDIGKLHLERRSDSYLSVFYGEVNDFLRFKYTDRTKWVTILIAPEDRQKYIDSPLFSAQKNKKQLQWKCKLNSLDDIDALAEIIINSCIEH